MSKYGPPYCLPTQHNAVSHSRAPWGIQQHCSDSRSSTTSSHSYHRIVPGTPYVPVDDCRYWDGANQHGTMVAPGYLQPSQIPVYQTTTRTHQEQHLLQQQQQQQQQAAHLQTTAYLEGATVLRHTPPSHNFNSASESGTGRRSYVPSPTEAVIVPCGGHCILLETFCHHFLQVVFVAGVLTGMCLVVAGLVLGVRSGPGGLPPLRASRGPDLSVLTYIGSMTSLVSALLLSVQCCGRQRGRLQPKTSRNTQTQQQQQLQQQQPLQGNREEIPLRQLPTLQPLLTEIVHQQITHHDHLREEESGIPWWRREATSC